LFFNMFALVMFGSALETRWGPKRFLFFYIFCALGAAALHTGYNYFDLNRQEKAIVSYEESPSFDGAFLYVKRFAPKYLKRQYISAKEYLEDVADKIDDGDPRYIEEGKKVMLDIYQYNRDIPTVGASGAIYGLLLAFGMMFPNAELMLLFLPIPIKAKYFIPLLMVGELFLGVNQFSWDNIAHFAHLGGALFGLILILYWQKYGSRWGGV
ncbi:MAG: rhomboid family intramembrane serine protease, partial [Bacteroidota bacterium]